ncbi:antitoxin of toxin-antitoxin stability system [Neorhizobium sp. P12A]|jgi:ferritin|uniref:CopG family ribbon-helix-helix protein n=1 Tax=Neorhizobium sp. P12A TaxID=2268027 RepID=UPI0011ECD8F0|nr:antitoxin of toxin-antitoxin stability system [Neorhizobium sp. P12A]KAA0700115.1 antitoxin of toxin-antitoxin stability system [Neorhizobium sp. P12A]
MPKTGSLKLDIDPDLHAQFDAAAKTAHRDVQDLILEFMQDYVAQQKEEEGYDAFLRAKVEKARISAAAGHLISGDEVERDAAAWRSRS